MANWLVKAGRLGPCRLAVGCRPCGGVRRPWKSVSPSRGGPPGRLVSAWSGDGIDDVQSDDTGEDDAGDAAGVKCRSRQCYDDGDAAALEAVGRAPLIPWVPAGSKPEPESRLGHRLSRVCVCSQEWQRKR